MLSQLFTRLCTEQNNTNKTIQRQGFDYLGSQSADEFGSLSSLNGYIYIFIYLYMYYILVLYVLYFIWPFLNQVIFLSQLGKMWSSL